MSNYILLIIFISSLFLKGCSGCSSSDRRIRRGYSAESHKRVEPDNNEPTEEERNGKTVVSMTKEGGVYKIPVEINGTEMYFIFDTGAGLISISTTEANFLYKQGKLSDSDILGTANFMDANGDISEGTVINLKKVKLGDRTLYNIKASVDASLTAPLLFGQSALQKFGRVSIDYTRSEITFE